MILKERITIDRLRDVARDAGLTTMDYRTVSCPVAEAMLLDGVSLPISPSMPDEMMDQTADALAKVVRYFAA